MAGCIEEEVMIVFYLFGGRILLRQLEISTCVPKIP